MLNAFKGYIQGLPPYREEEGRFGYWYERDDLGAAITLEVFYQGVAWRHPAGYTREDFFFAARFDELFPKSGRQVITKMAESWKLMREYEDMAMVAKTPEAAALYRMKAQELRKRTEKTEAYLRAQQKQKEG